MKGIKRRLIGLGIPASVQFVLSLVSFPVLVHKRQFLIGQHFQFSQSVKHRSDSNRQQNHLAHLIALIEAGASLHTVQALLGHRQIKTTMVYLHLTHRSEQDSLALVEKMTQGLPR